MKRKILYGILMATFAVSVFGCSKESEINNSEKKVVTTDDKSDGKQTDSANEEEIVEELLSKYVDVEAYEDAGGKIADNQLDEVIDGIVISGQTLQLGMSYDEVIAAGFEPIDDTFKDTETNALAYTCDFKDSNNKIVEFGFIGEQGKHVAEGVLYSVRVVNSDDAASYMIEGINENTQIEGILDGLGDPVGFGNPAYSEYTDVGLEYACKDASVYLTFYVDLETGEIITMTFEGYAED